jgi:hypothetical protein
VMYDATAVARKDWHRTIFSAPGVGPHIDKETGVPTT